MDLYLKGIISVLFSQKILGKINKIMVIGYRNVEKLLVIGCGGQEAKTKELLLLN